MDNIESIIKNANLDEICNPTEGDCESVAVALHRVFNAESFVCIFDPTADEHPVHATAKINNTLYDGYGTRTQNGLLDHISYLKISDFHDQIETPNELETEIKNGLKEFPTEKYGTTLLNYDETLVNKIVTQLKNTQA